MIRQNPCLSILIMNKKKNLVFFLIFVLLASCSFDKKTGIWSGEEKEKVKISKIEEEQKKIKNVINIYSSENIYSKEISTIINRIGYETKRADGGIGVIIRNVENV